MSAPVKKCQVCDDTGSRYSSKFLDCTQCGAAVERSEFDSKIYSGEKMSIDDRLWRAYQLGKAAAAPVVPVAAQPVVQPGAFPERDQSQPAERQGVFHKFDVRRVDGSDAPGGKHHGCRYFVLDMDHDQHAGPALAAYAASCAATHPALSAELAAEFVINTNPNVAFNDSGLRRKLEDYFSGHDISTEEMVSWVKIYANHNRAAPSLEAQPAGEV